MKTINFISIGVISLFACFSTKAQVHELQPYAYIQANGVNRIDTGYLPSGKSRFVIDYQLLAVDHDIGIFGSYLSDNVHCVVYTPKTAQTLTLYFRNIGGSASFKLSAYDTKRRVLAFKPGSGSVCLYNDRSAVLSGSHPKGATLANTTASISLFALGDSSYLKGNKRIYSFEASDDGATSNPTIFFAPSINADGEAGFIDVISGAFHGEAQKNVDESKKLVFSDGVGAASDYKVEDGKLHIKFRAYASDEEMGSVAFNENQPSGTAEEWVARESSISLKAIPKEGLFFAGWSGDTWAISSGTEYDEEVTLSNTSTAVQLLANFEERPLHWTGEGNDGNWFNPSNWRYPDGKAVEVISSGDNFTFDMENDTTINYNPSESDFVISKILISENAGSLTITGGEMSSLKKIKCLNNKENKFLNEVTFTGAIDVQLLGEGYINFAGGVKGSTFVNHSALYGKYTITATGDWLPPFDYTVKSGSEFNLPYGTYYDHRACLTIEEGAVVTVLKTKTGSNNEKHLVKKNMGVFKATNEMFSETALWDGKGGGYMEDNSGGGVYIVNKLRMTRVLIPPYMPTLTIVGEGGIVHGLYGYVRVVNKGVQYLGSYADWQIIYNNLDVNKDTTLKGICKIDGASTLSTMIFDTTDYYDNTIGRTITAQTGIGGVNAEVAQSLNVVVQGNGMFVFANTGINDCDFSGGLIVSNSATVAVLQGAMPGRGSVALRDSSTLKVASSGRLQLEGELSLEENASLAFHFTQEDVAPLLAAPSVGILPETINVKLSAEQGISLKEKSYTLSDGIDFSGKKINLLNKPDWAYSVSVDSNGDLVFTPQKPPLVIVIR